METVCIANSALIGGIIYIAVAYIFALVIGWIDGDCMEGLAFTMCLVWPLSIPIYILIGIGECLFKFYEKHGGSIKKVLFPLFLPLRPIKIGSLLSDRFSKWRNEHRRSKALKDPVIRQIVETQDEIKAYIHEHKID